MLIASITVKHHVQKHPLFCRMFGFRNGQVPNFSFSSMLSPDTKTKNIPGKVRLPPRGGCRSGALSLLRPVDLWGLRRADGAVVRGGAQTESRRLLGGSVVAWQRTGPFGTFFAAPKNGGSEIHCPKKNMDIKELGFFYLTLPFKKLAKSELMVAPTVPGMAAGHTRQGMAPCWFVGRMAPKATWSLANCVVAPGYFDGFLYQKQRCGYVQSNKIFFSVFFIFKVANMFIFIFFCRLVNVRLSNMFCNQFIGSKPFKPKQKKTPEVCCSSATWLSWRRPSCCAPPRRSRSDRWPAGDFVHQKIGFLWCFSGFFYGFCWFLLLILLQKIFDKQTDIYQSARFENELIPFSWLHKAGSWFVWLEKWLEMIQLWKENMMKNILWGERFWMVQLL